MTTTHEIGTDAFTGADRYDGDYGEDEEVFCKNCGENEENCVCEIVCSKCKSINRTQDELCKNCGGIIK